MYLEVSDYKGLKKSIEWVKRKIVIFLPKETLVKNKILQFLKISIYSYKKNNLDKKKKTEKLNRLTHQVIARY